MIHLHILSGPPLLAMCALVFPFKTFVLTLAWSLGPLLTVSDWFPEAEASAEG